MRGVGEMRPIHEAAAVAPSLPLNATRNHVTLYALVGLVLRRHDAIATTQRLRCSRPRLKSSSSVISAFYSICGTTGMEQRPRIFVVPGGSHGHDPPIDAAIVAPTRREFDTVRPKLDH